MASVYEHFVRTWHTDTVSTAPCWLDSGYMFASVFEVMGNFTHFLRESGTRLLWSPSWLSLFGNRDRYAQCKLCRRLEIPQCPLRSDSVVVQTCRKLWCPTVAVFGQVGHMPVVVNDRCLEVPQVLFLRFDVTVFMQRRCLATVKVPQIQFIAQFEDTPVAQQRRLRTVQLCLAGLVWPAW